MPRPRKPRHLKLLAGTLQPCRDVPEPPAVGGVLERVPAPPDWLPNAHAVREWDRLAGILVANRLLHEGALSALGMLCGLHGMIVAAFSANAMPQAALVGQLRALYGAFGLVRGPPLPAPPRASPNRFANRGRPPQPEPTP